MKFKDAVNTTTYLQTLAILFERYKKSSTIMNDMLQSQIHESCKLALPEGLKELMSDITREVLRAQPQNIYQFIANYLEALMEARETLAIACQVCHNVYTCTCEPDLYSELKKIGLYEEDLEKVTEIIEEHFKVGQGAKGTVKEQSLLLKLLRNTSIDETRLADVQNAIRNAFKKYHLGYGDKMEFPNKSNKETSEAVRHTLNLYEHNQTKPEDIFVAPEYKPCVTSVSSTSLAGSHVDLPKYRPYSAHDSKILSAIPEKEQISIDYTLDTTTDITSNKIEISKERTILEETDEKEKVFVFFDDNNDIIYDYDDNEIQEAIECVESENESTASSITESLQDNIVNRKLDIL